MTRKLLDWSALQAAICGHVILPGSPDYEPARKPAIARFHDTRLTYRPTERPAKG